MIATSSQLRENRRGEDPFSWKIILEKEGAKGRFEGPEFRQNEKERQ